MTPTPATGTFSSSASGSCLAAGGPVCLVGGGAQHIHLYTKEGQASNAIFSRARKMPSSSHSSCINPLQVHVSMACNSSWRCHNHEVMEVVVGPCYPVLLDAPLQCVCYGAKDLGCRVKAEWQHCIYVVGCPPTQY